MKKLKITRDAKSPEIDFTNWNLPAAEHLKDLVSDAAQTAIGEAMKFAVSYKAHAWFPAEWDFGDNPSDGVGGKPPVDPSTIYVELPLGPDEDESPRWAFTLSELVEQLVEGCTGRDGIFGTDHVRSASALRDCFRSLADKIDAALPKAK